jgi:hypothetical protein
MIVVGCAIAVAAALVVLRRSGPPPDESARPAAETPSVTAAADRPHPPSAALPTRPQPAPVPAPLPPADDEAAATARARATLRSDPEGALALLDAGDRLHPDSGFAEERAALRVDALVFAQRIGPARDAAEIFLSRFPGSPRAQHIEMLTGVHPRPTDPGD